MKLGGYLGLAALALSLAATPAQSQSLQTDAAGLRELATLSLTEGNWAQARQLAEALLMRDPADPRALAVLAKAAFELRDFAVARSAAARLYRSDASQIQRYEAARLAALAAANEDRFTLSEIWLRRALIVAPSDDDVARTTQDARQIRRVNPWSTSVQLAFSPSTNINGGAESELNVIDGVPLVGVLSASAQALTGFVALADIKTTYRLAESRESRQTVSARIYARAPIPVGEDLQAIWDEGVEIEDLSTARLEFSFNHDQVITDGLYGVDLYAGLYFSGAEFDHSYVRLAADRTFRFSPELSLNAAVVAEQRFAPETFERDDALLTLQGAVTRRIDGVGTASATGSWTRRFSDSINYSYDSYTLQLGFAPAERVGPAIVSGNIGITHTTYDDYAVGFILVPDGRQDTRYFGNLTATFPDYSYAGFQPQVKVNLGTTQSNISRFEIDELGVEFGLRSTF